jgi:monoamine oxidase
MTDASISPRSSDDVDVDVVVVGGGIAGLVVATHLIEGGLRCHVFEKSERVGGRLLTHHNASGHFDLGATWYWPGEARAAALIDQLGIPTHAHNLDGDAMYHAPSGVQRLYGNPIDVASRRFSQGAASLTDRLAERMTDVVSLHTTVHQIEYRPDLYSGAIRVTHTNGSLTTRHVVVAIPPSVAVDTITFRPELPDAVMAVAAATPVWMGNIVKVVVVYEHAFWRVAGLSGSAMSHIGPLREIHDMSGPNFEPAALFGFVALQPDEPAPNEHDIIDQLGQIFGAEASSPVEILIKDWRTDPHGKRFHTNQLTPMETYGHHVYQEPTGNGRIHWASTETATSSPGHIEGALAAAERTMTAIVRQVQHR